ncbi:uncharacterized protein LOC135174606 [Pogoniulus pusillus]|uniref:uncharacterized protein LOC135174606 n=1 Tax=Pogoniulus pusillus TaxID=488313 RepID=UPI0030B9A1FC
MARAKQTLATGGRKKPPNAPSPSPKPPAKRPPPPSRPPAPWKKLLRPPKKRSELLLPSAAIRGLLRGVCGLRASVEVQGEAVAALRAGCEAQLLALFEDLRLCAGHAERVAVHAADLSLLRCLRLGRG